ncbi:transposase domain-containing protein [Paraburkholderia sp. WSM4175]
MYSLIGTARLNAIEPYSWLERTLEQLPSYPVNRVHELLPFAR